MSSSSSKHKVWWHDVVAGGTAGLCEMIITYPLDVIKTRFQATISVNRGFLSSLRYAIATEGFMIYRGIFFPLLTEVPKRAIKFTTYSFNLNVMHTPCTISCMISWSLQQIRDNGLATGAKAAAWAGWFTGCTEGLLFSSPELIKIRLQIPENKKLYSSSIQAAISIVQKEGVRAILVGSTVAMVRNGSWNMCYFGSIPTFKSYLPSPSPSNNIERLFTDVIAGTCAGTIGTIVNTPFDVIKTRMQNLSAQKQIAPHLYRDIPLNPVLLGMHIIRIEGWKALWKGFVPKVVRLGPGGGVLLFVYDYISQQLRKD